MAIDKKKLGIGGVRLCWQEQHGRAVVLGLEGNAVRLCIPEQIEGYPVTQIEKKAFFNCPSLQYLTLPDSLEEIGNWAFAHCGRLKRVEMPCRSMLMGRDLFIGSDALQEIVLRPQLADTAAMLAAAATKMGDPHLFRIEEAGTKDWMRRFDARMLVILREPDSAGFDGQIMTGEEDYVATDFGRFIREKRKSKVRLCYLRLLHSDDLSEVIRQELEEYLCSHTKGCESEEAWQVLLHEFGEEKEYYELFARLGCVTQDNFDGILQDIKEGLPEMKAYLMRYKEEQLGYTDFFDSLSLDF